VEMLKVRLAGCGAICNREVTARAETASTGPWWLRALAACSGPLRTTYLDQSGRRSQQSQVSERGQG
jgi:hypothetical protein